MMMLGGWEKMERKSSHLMWLSFYYVLLLLTRMILFELKILLGIIQSSIRMFDIPSHSHQEFLPSVNGLLQGKYARLPVELTL